jgi:hypothetical protein
MSTTLTRFALIAFLGFGAFVAADASTGNTVTTTVSHGAKSLDHVAHENAK